MEFRKLDLKLISATDLKSVNFFSKMDVYVVVSILDASYRQSSHKQKTPVDKNGDKNPTWNYTLSFTLDNFAVEQNRLTILFGVYSSRVMLPDTRIGEVYVPVSDLLSGAGDVKGSNMRSYQVRGRSGKQKGVLNFSYSFGEKFTVAPPANSYGYQPMGQPVTAYPPPAVGGGVGYPYQGQGYGYGSQGYAAAAQAQPRRNNFGNFGMGLLGGALAGMVIGDVVSDGFGGGCGGGGCGGGGCGGGGCGGM